MADDLVELSLGEVVPADVEIIDGSVLLDQLFPKSWGGTGPNRLAWPVGAVGLPGTARTGVRSWW